MSLEGEIIKQNQELLWAHIFHDSIRGKKALEKLSLNIGRWAGNYSFFYVLNRILSDYKPQNILELGLGESSKLVSTHLNNYLPKARHLIIEHDQDWKNRFESLFTLSDRSEIIISALQQRIVNQNLVNSYSNFEQILNRKFDLYIIDGPFGSTSFSRYDIIFAVENFNVSDNFILLIDDFDRKGEQETVREIEKILIEKNIKIYKGIYSGIKGVAVLGSEKYKGVESL